MSRRPKRTLAAAAGEFQSHQHSVADVVLAAQLDAVWAVEEADTSRLLSLCDQAVQRADADGEPQGRFWAHLTRALLARNHQSSETSRADFEAALACSSRISQSRAQRLLRICEADQLAAAGSHRQAFDYFCGMRLASIDGVDDPDDYFILSGTARCAARLHELESQFNALYANLLLTERKGPAIRNALVSADLAEALIAIGQADEALKLLEGKVAAVASRWRNAQLLARFKANMATAKFAQGRAIDAYYDFLNLVHDNSTPLTTTAQFDVHSNLVAICIQRGLYADAERSLELAYEAARAMSRSAPLGLCHAAAGFIAHERGLADLAIELFEQAMACFEQDLPINPPAQGLVDIGAVLSPRLVAKGRHDLAYVSQRRVFDIQRQRVDYENRGQIAAMKAQLDVAASIRLSARELECLEWSAAGKTAWETGKILGLSEWTVVYHLEKAKRKFGMNRKNDVIAHAISLGLIRPGREAASN